MASWKTRAENRIKILVERRNYLSNLVLSSREPKGYHTAELTSLDWALQVVAHAATLVQTPCQDSLKSLKRVVKENQEW